MTEFDTKSGSNIHEASPAGINDNGQPIRVFEVIKNTPDLSISISDAAKCHDVHSQLQGYIVYSIQLGPLLVKRRYSEFESLRLNLTKLFPTSIIPPIPEKQSLSSNIATTTTNSLRRSSNTTGENGEVGGTSHNTESQNSRLSLLSIENNKAIKVVEYRKRMLTVFLNRCLGIPKIANSSFFMYFLDPLTNFHDFLNKKENSTFNKTSIYQLSPYDPIGQIENQLYLTLPIPSSSDATLLKDLSQEESFLYFVNFESKFLKYEFVLNNISKINKHLLKHFSELTTELSDLGSNFNKLSLLEDSDKIEILGKAFERRNLYLTGLCDALNLDFLDKLIELKNFSTTAKELIEYNRKKLIQHKLVERDLFNSRARCQRYEAEERRIKKIDDQTRSALGEGTDDNGLDVPITDDELQTVLYTKSKKSLYDNIPGINKINNMILKYVNDPNPDETRRNKFHNMKLRIFQLERQYDILNSELERVNDDVIKELESFHTWFKKQIAELTSRYDETFKNFIGSCKTTWDDIK